MHLFNYMPFCFPYDSMSINSFSPEGAWRERKKLKRNKMYRRFRGQKRVPLRYARKQKVR